MTIQNWPKNERPREKLLQHGPTALSNSELLAIFLRTGCRGKTAVDLARDITQSFGSLRQLFQASLQEFTQINGLGQAKYVQLQAVLEMAKRCFFEELKQIHTINNIEQTKNYLIAKLGDYQYEMFACLFLNNKCHILHFAELFRGTTNKTAIYPREIVKLALNYNATAVIAVHNHPSGNPFPSQADKKLTKYLQESLALVDIRLLDHIIVTMNKAISFTEIGLL